MGLVPVAMMSIVWFGFAYTKRVKQARPNDFISGVVHLFYPSHVNYRGGSQLLRCRCRCGFVACMHSAVVDFDGIVNV